VRPPSGRPATWLLAVALVALVDAAITRTRVLWGHIPTENTIDPQWAQISQTYQVARKLFHDPGRPAPVRVALLGDSRIWFAGHAPYVERALAAVAPDLDVRVDDLGIFGALAGDLAMVSRHVDRLEPQLVVLALGPAQLLPDESGRLGNVPAALLDFGWGDSPLPAPTYGARAERWARTLWPLFRFRELARGVLWQRVFPEPEAHAPLPDRVSSPRELFDFLYGADGAAADAAFETWRRAPTLERYVDYLRVVHSRWLDDRSGPLRGSARLADADRALGMLDWAVARLRGEHRRVVVLLMPENPVLDADTAGRYHDPALSDRAAGLVRTVARRQGVDVVDGRRWMPAEAFFDLLHLFPDVSGFQRPLAEEIVRALGT
jgi:hypothetical protein